MGVGCGGVGGKKKGQRATSQGVQEARNKGGPRQTMESSNCKR